MFCSTLLCCKSTGVNEGDSGDAVGEFVQPHESEAVKFGGPSCTAAAGDHGSFVPNQCQRYGPRATIHFWKVWLWSWYVLLVLNHVLESCGSQSVSKYIVHFLHSEPVYHVGNALKFFLVCSGRPAAKRKVLLFANRGQYAPTEDKYDTMFLGQFTTDSNGTLGPVHVPESMSTTPGHYNVLALLPQDNTFARGSLFILEPKTKCVLFDLDGTVTVRSCHTSRTEVE